MTGYISAPASNAIIYCTLCFFLVMGVVVGYLHMRKQKKQNQGSEGFLSANNTKTALPLAINFVASGEYQQ